MTKQLSFLLILSQLACAPVKVEVSGKTKHEISIDLNQLSEIFRSLCEDEEPDNVEECTNKKLAELLKLLVE